MVKIKLNVDNAEMDKVVAKYLKTIVKDYEAMKKNAGNDGVLPMYSYDAQEERDLLHGDILCLEHVIGMLSTEG